MEEEGCLTRVLGRQAGGWRFYGSMLFSAILASSVIYGVQYHCTLEVFTQQVVPEAEQIAAEADAALIIYENMLASLSAHITTDHAWRDETRLARLIKTFYQIASTSNLPKIGCADLYWINKGGHRKVTRYGTVDPLDMPLESAILVRNHAPSRLHLHAFRSKGAASHKPSWYGTMAVVDSNKTVQGHLVIQLTFPTWMAARDRRLGGLNLAMRWVDGEQRTVAAAQAVSHAKPSDYQWIAHHPLRGSAYQLQVGYNVHHLQRRLWEAILPLWMLLWASACWAGVLWWRTVRTLNQRMTLSWRDAVECLQASNRSLETQQRLLEEKLANIQSMLNTYQTGYRVMEGLMQRVHDRMAGQLTEIRELLKVLVQVREGMVDIPMTVEKESEVLANTYNRLVYLSELCVHDPEGAVCIASWVNEAVDFMAPELVMQSLSILPKISQKLQAVPCYGLWLQQIVLSLLHKAVRDARPNSTILLEATRRKLEQRDHLVLSVQCAGFGLSPSLAERIHDRDPKRRSPFMLDMDVMQDMVALHQGHLETKYGKTGQTLTLILPIEPAPGRKARAQMAKKGNVVPFKRPENI